MRKHIAVVALAAAFAAACADGRSVTDPALSLDRTHDGAGAGVGAVYSLTNTAAGNAVVVFQRAADGALTPAGAVPTGGTGTGAGLGSQGSVALSGNGRWLFAANAGSHDVTVFGVDHGGLDPVGRFPSGGSQPISLTTSGNIVYVLNAGGSGNIAGFSLSGAGALTPIAGSTQPLSGPAVGPAQVSFSSDGRWLVVAEKNSNLLTVYPVGLDGTAGAPTTFPSAGVTPFGFEFGLRNELFVSEAGGTASSYQLGTDGGLSAVSPALNTTQGAPCWLVVTADGRFAYTANAASGSISALGVTSGGALSLIAAAAAAVPAGNLDLALSRDSRYLYQLTGVTGSGARAVAAFRVRADGSLQSLGMMQGMAASAAGLAAF